MKVLTILLLNATPFYQRWWFWLLVFIGLFFLTLYVLRWWASRKYRSIMEERKKANARIRELLKEMKER